jgi:hypothetical protein
MRVYATSVEPSCRPQGTVHLLQQLGAGKRGTSPRSVRYLARGLQLAANSLCTIRGQTGIGSVRQTVLPRQDSRCLCESACCHQGRGTRHMDAVCTSDERTRSRVSWQVHTPSRP